MIKDGPFEVLMGRLRVSPGASRWLKYREKLLSFYSFFVGVAKLPPACSHPEEFTYPSSGQSCRGFLLLSSLTDPKNRRLPHIKGLTVFTHDKGFTHGASSSDKLYTQTMSAWSKKCSKYL